MVVENRRDAPPVHVHDDAARLLDRLTLFLIEDVIGNYVHRLSEHAEDSAIAPANAAEIARDYVDGLAARLRIISGRSVLNDAAETFLERRELALFHDAI